MPVPSIGSEIAVNASSAGVQLFPTVAAIGDGRFVIGWHDVADNHHKLRVFNADGTYNSQVDTTLLSTLSAFSNTIENRIELAGLPGNDFAAVYTADANAGDVLYDRYTFSSGLGVPLRANLVPVNVDNGSEAGLEENPCVTVSALGAVLIGYVNAGADRNVASKIYSASNLIANGGELARAGDQVQVEGVSPPGFGLLTVFRDVPSGNVCMRDTDSVVGAGSHPHIAALADGGLAVAWDGVAGDVLVRVYDSSVFGQTPRTAAITVDGAGAGSQSHVCALQDGRFLVVWQEVFIAGQVSSDLVLGRLYNPDGTPDSSAFTIDQFNFPTAGEPVTGAPRAAQLADGRVVVTYQDGRASDADIRAKILDPRLEGVAVAGTPFGDDHVGSVFGDVFVEGAGNDKVDGGGGNDGLYGGSGDDILTGGSGADLMNGGPGNDWFYVDNAGDGAFEAAGQGSDRMFASVSYTLGAGVQVETLTTTDNAGTAAINLTGNEFANTIFGNAGANTLDGKGGADTLVGFSGDDWYFADNALDQVYEAVGQGNDRVFTSVTYTLPTAAEIEALSTTDKAGLAAINLTGNALGDTILGNDGSNGLIGLGGSDTLIGYGGADAFVFNTALGAGDVDHIVDFNFNAALGDQIVLHHGIFATLAPGALPASAYRIGTAALDADDRVIYNPNTGELSYDADGLGGAADVRFAVLDNLPNLDSTQFFVA